MKAGIQFSQWNQVSRHKIEQNWVKIFKIWQFMTRGFSPHLVSIKKTQLFTESSPMPNMYRTMGPACNGTQHSGEHNREFGLESQNSIELFHKGDIFLPFWEPQNCLYSVGNFTIKPISLSPMSNLAQPCYFHWNPLKQSNTDPCWSAISPAQTSHNPLYSRGLVEPNDILVKQESLETWSPFCFVKAGIFNFRCLYSVWPT